MRSFVRRQVLYFLAGFVATFIVYLFVRFDVDDVILGITIATAGGAATSIVLFLLGRQFANRNKPAPSQASPDNRL